MARKSLATMNAATVTPAPVKSAPKEAQPKVLLSDAATLGEKVNASLRSAGMPVADLPTPRASQKEISALFVGQAKASLLALAAEITTTAKALDATGVTLKPTTKGTSGRIVVSLSPDLDGVTWCQGAISIDLDGAIGTAVRALFA